MGMYNTVKYETICGNCRNIVNDFQTKSGKLKLVTVEPNTVNQFYSTCKKCGCWIEFNSCGEKVYIKTTSKGQVKKDKLINIKFVKIGAKDL